MRVGIITDIHENAEMLQEALRLADFNKCDDLACLGDMVGYDRRFYKYDCKRSAKTCLDLIRSNCRWIVAGNHDLFAAGKFPSYTNGFEYPDNWYKMNSEERKSVSAGKVWSYEGDAPNDLGENEIEFLKSLPEYFAISLAGVDSLFSHYIYPDLTGSTTKYIERSFQLKGLWEFMNKKNVKYSFSGHSHASFAGFAYRGKLNGAGSYLKAIHSLSSDNFNLGNEMVMIQLPPIAAEKGRAGFSIIDTETMKLTIIPVRIV
jgi:predicted phosphodiesterase